jgi:hypothetical protein
MVLEDLKKDLTEAHTNVRSYLEKSEEYLELKVFKILMRFLIWGQQTVLVSLAVVFVLIFISLGISLALCEVLDSHYLGFIAVGGFYVVICFLVFIFRRKLNGPMLRKFSTFYFDET